MTTVEERLSRLEGVYEHLASKADAAQLRTEVQSVIGRIQSFRAEANSRFDSIEGRLDRIESKLDRLIFTLFGAGLAFGAAMAVLLVRSFAG